MISVEREGCRKNYKCKQVELVKSNWPSDVAQLILNLSTAMLLTEGNCLLPFYGNLLVLIPNGTLNHVFKTQYLNREGALYDLSDSGNFRHTHVGILHSPCCTLVVMVSLCCTLPISVGCNEKAISNLINSHRCIEQTAQFDNKNQGFNSFTFSWFVDLQGTYCI